MSLPVKRIKTKEDALVLSRIILESLDNDGPGFNPFRERLTKRGEETILFLGQELTRDDACQEIAGYIWIHRRQLNRQIKAWDVTGGVVVNCGC